MSPTSTHSASAKTNKELLRKTSFIVSQLTNPILVVAVGLSIMTFHYTDSYKDFVEWTLIGLALIVGPGLLYTTVTWLKNRQIDIDLSKREDRVVPLLLSTMGAVFVSFLVNSRLDSASLVLVSYVLVAMLVALTFTTLVWKISFHAATPAAAVTLLVLFRGPEYAWLYLIIFPVVWSRLVLKQHTPAQLVAGVLCGVVLTYAAFLIFRP